MALYSWDIETTEWDQILCVAAVSDEGDEITFAGPDALERMGREMVERGGTWVAHYGGGFDVPLLLNCADPPVKRIVLSGSNILCAEVNGRTKLRDTFPLTLASLAKIGQWVGVEKDASMAAQRADLGALSPAIVMDYCLGDCRTLLAGVQAIHKFMDDLGATRAWTAGSAAIQILKALEPGTWNLLRRHAIEGEWLRVAINAIRGGRVECFARGRKPRVWSYDFKSSYPARYAAEPLGVGLRKAKEADWLKDTPAGLFRASWYSSDRTRIPPVLDQMTACGAGYCEAWVCGEELQDLREAAEIHSLEVHEGWAPETIAAVGQDFAARMFAEKEAGSPWAKVMVNSLHGKFSEDPLKECWTEREPRADQCVGPSPELRTSGARSFWRWFEWSLDKRGRAPAHAQPIAAGQILGRARAALSRVLRAVQAAGWEVYYCDTDSVHTNCPPEHFPIPLGDSLGELAIESGEEACEAIYLGPKAYVLHRDGEIVKSALKGAPFRSMADATTESTPEGTLYRQARNGEPGQDLRLQLFAEAADRGHILVQKEGITSFVSGLKPSGWKRSEMTRTIRPSGSGKTFHKSGAWRYLSPSELGS